MKIITNQDEKGKTVYSSEILFNLVLCALKEVEGVVDFDINNAKEANKNHKLVKIETVNDMIYVDVYVKVRPDVKVTEVAYNIQQSIKNAFDTMVEFKVKEINVHIIGVKND
jgi:uncharacterized alkaline shock family protein YloU